MATTHPPRKLWVLLNSNDSAVVNHPVKVSTNDCEDVDDFIDAIKKKLSPDLDAVAVNRITLHITEYSPALRPGLALSTILAQSGFINNDKSPLVVTVPPPAPTLVCMAYGKADMPFISESTEVQEDQEVWENIPVDESIVPRAEFVELFKKNCLVFEFETEASRRTVIDLFLREIVSHFPAFQVICEYHMTHVNEVKKRRLNGRCDYVVAIEAKLTNKETMLQCIGECASIHYRRKHAGMPNRCVYGIHSTGSVWKFVFVSQEGVVFVSGEKHLDVKHYVEKGFNLIYRLVHYVIQQSFLNSPRITPNVSTNLLQ
jgi:hypothetical protein